MLIRALLVAVLVSAVLATPVAQAQSPADLAAARTAFEAGTRFLDGSQFPQAIAAFERSLVLRESPAARYNLALAYRGAHRPTKAIDSLRRLLANRGNAAQAMIDEAGALLAALERELAHATVRVVGTATDVAVDHEPLVARAEQTVDLDPGRHAFTAHAAGGSEVTVERTLAAGARVEIVLDVASGAGAPAHLVVRTGRDDGRIAIDGVDRGTGTFDGDVAPGHHAVRVSASGVTPRDVDVELRAGATRELDVQLASAAGGGGGGGGGPGILGEWWFWTVVGVVVVGVTVGVIVGVTSGEADPVEAPDGLVRTLVAF